MIQVLFGRGRPRKRRFPLLLFYFGLLATFFAAQLLPAPLRAQETEAPRLVLATTTSTDNSGLLSVLIPPFEKRFGVRVDIIAVGTGRALKLGERGDADVLLVHAPDAEKEFVRAGYGVNRRSVMYNDFVFLGPPSDPANISEADSAVDALRRIASTGSRFVSRGDESGTHKKEQALWKALGFSPIRPPKEWYLSVGQGMGATLRIANETVSYTLCDRGTYLAYQGKIDLKILFEGDEILFNPYSVIAVNPDRHPQVNYLMAMTFIGWITSPEGQEIIRTFQVGGQNLFIPTAVVPKDD